MEKISKLLIVICCIISFSCNKDQKLVSEIAGEYRIESITNYNKGQSSTVNITGGTIFFQDCTMKDGVGGNCTGWYEVNGLARVSFQYFTRKEKGAKTIRISSPSRFIEPVIIGYYEFDKEGGFMLLNGVEGPPEANSGVSYSDYSDIKLSKK